MQIGMGFWASKTLLTAVKLNLFTEIGDGSLSNDELRMRLGLHTRSSADFFDTLVSLGMLNRTGNGAGCRYCNTLETRLFLVQTSPAYIGGLLEMANDRLYPFWGSLEEALRTGLPQNEVKQTGKSAFEAIYEQPAVLEQFMDGMAGAQAGNFMALANAFDFGSYNSLCDIGGANGLLSVCVARLHPYIQCLSVDMPPVAPIAVQHIARQGLSRQIEAGTLDFMSEPFPGAEVITMGNILHDWNLDVKKMLIRKAFVALPENGVLIVVENIIDDNRRENTFGLLMSLNMLIETEGGFDYTHADFNEWAIEAGFQSTVKLALTGPSSALIAYK
ncbi:acetylserotonin O-methyltransferase [Dyadobacter sp. NIV53]|uniref:acetylserotonin O-methyltransferase n=1 Tax=Dyadobacter sp. NIV53 TaxID=2861765 RepID=UPI002104FF8A|nr:acetylserotonin O-methyltransferase [Dyadobacter sp. NIV53]